MTDEADKKEIINALCNFDGKPIHPEDQKIIDEFQNWLKMPPGNRPYVPEKVEEFNMNSAYPTELTADYAHPYAKRCEHDAEDGCYYCCHSCDIDGHYCPGCGKHTSHRIRVCKDCAEL